jgi:hypothetical protein
MTSKNDITGDTIATKNSTEAYRENFDRIFGKKGLDDVTPLSNNSNQLVADPINSNSRKESQAAGNS